MFAWPIVVKAHYRQKTSGLKRGLHVLCNTHYVSCWIHLAKSLLCNNYMQLIIWHIQLLPISIAVLLEQFNEISCSRTYHAVYRPSSPGSFLSVVGYWQTWDRLSSLIYGSLSFWTQFHRYILPRHSYLQVSNSGRAISQLSPVCIHTIETWKAYKGTKPSELGVLIKQSKR